MLQVRILTSFFFFFNISSRKHKDLVQENVSSLVSTLFLFIMGPSLFTGIRSFKIGNVRSLASNQCAGDLVSILILSIPFKYISRIYLYICRCPDIGDLSKFVKRLVRLVFGKLFLNQHYSFVNLFCYAKILIS